MLIRSFYFIEIFFVFVVIFIDNRCVRGDNQTTTKLPQTTLDPARKIIKVPLIVTKVASKIIPHAGHPGTVKPQIAKHTKANFLNNTICDKNQTEICKTPLEIWNPDRCKCEKKVNNQNVTVVGSRMNKTATSLLPQSLSPPLPTGNTTSAAKTIKTKDISYRSPFMPRLG